VLAKETYEETCHDISFQPEECVAAKTYTKLIKLDDEGNQEWEWRREMINKSGLQVAEIVPGTYILQGSSTQSPSREVLWLAAFDDDGDKRWDMEDDQPIRSINPVFMEKTSTSIVVVTGFYDEERGYCMYTLTVDAEDGVMDRRVTTLPSAAGGQLVGFALSTDGGFVAAVERGDDTGAIASFGPDGSLRWSRTFSGGDGDPTRPLQVRVMPDGNVAATFGGWEGEAQGSGTALKLLDGDHLGNLLETFRFMQVTRDLEVLDDGSLLVVGSGADRAILYKVDGSETTALAAGSAMSSDSVNAAPTDDGGFLLWSSTARMETYDSSGDFQWFFESQR